MDLRSSAQARPPAESASGGRWWIGGVGRTSSIHELKCLPLPEVGDMEVGIASSY